MDYPSPAYSVKRNRRIRVRFFSQNVERLCLVDPQRGQSRARNGLIETPMLNQVMDSMPDFKADVQRESRLNRLGKPCSSD